MQRTWFNTIVKRYGVFALCFAMLQGFLFSAPVLASDGFDGAICASAQGAPLTPNTPHHHDNCTLLSCAAAAFLYVAAAQAIAAREAQPASACIFDSADFIPRAAFENCFTARGPPTRA